MAIQKNKKMKRLIILTVIFNTIALILPAQRTYFETEISGELFKNIEISLSPQVRFREEFDLKEYLFDAGADYKISKYLSLGTSYRLGTNISRDDEKTTFGRWSFDAKTSVKLNSLKPSFRLRYTNGNEDFGDDSEENEQYLRYKLELAYSLSSLNISPYVYTEYFQNIAGDNLDYTRFEGGLDYKLGKHHKLGAYFRTNVESDSKEIQRIIGLSYKFKL